MPVKSIVAHSPPIGVVGMFREGVLAQVSSPSLHHGSILRGPSPIALEFVAGIPSLKSHLWGFESPRKEGLMPIH
ncbi:hypothetical protein TNCV_2529271 [Trichonephila clavipes]|nr:hypothetical protein TNCV_2529271 [Trichonephila clavipes]